MRSFSLNSDAWIIIHVLTTTATAKQNAELGLVAPAPARIRVRLASPSGAERLGTLCLAAGRRQFGDPFGAPPSFQRGWGGGRQG